MNIKFFISLIIAFTLGAGIGYYFGYDIGSRKGAKSRPLSKTGETTSGFRVGRNTIYVQDQAPGETLTIGFAALEQAGFVVIHEAKGGKPGGVIGKSDLIPAGETKNFPSIALSRKALDGEMLFAMLHRDDGDRTFNPVKDVPITDDGGEPFMMQFMIDRNAVEQPGAISL